jgi:hypothetical protein
LTAHVFLVTARSGDDAGLAPSGLDVAVDRGDAERLRGWLAERGYTELPRPVAAAWMSRFKTAYPPAEKDLADVRALHEKFGFPIPPSYLA